MLPILYEPPEVDLMASARIARDKRLQPTETELMAEARRCLDKRLLEAPAILAIAATPRPVIRTPEQGERRMRSLRSCHLPSVYERPRHAPPSNSGAYVPACAARLDDDPNLTDGARRCARKIMEETHRRNRQGRNLQVNVSYLARGLRRSCRTIQRYLRMLEREGYLRIQVMAGHRSRLCIGLIVQLLEPLFPPHHRKSWPGKLGNPPKYDGDPPENSRNPGTTFESQNEREKFFKKKEEPVDPLLRTQPYVNSYHARFRCLHEPRCRLYERQAWTERCRAGVFRALLKAVPPPDLAGKGMA